MKSQTGKGGENVNEKGRATKEKSIIRYRKKTMNERQKERIKKGEEMQTKEKMDKRAR